MHTYLVFSYVFWVDMSVQKMKKVPKQSKEDKEFARRTEKAWKQYEKGKFKCMDSEDFLKELEKW